MSFQFTEEGEHGVFRKMGKQENVVLETKDGIFQAHDLLDQGSGGSEKFVSCVQSIIQELNGGHDFGIEVAEEWAHHLQLFIDGYGQNLSNPYSDLDHYTLEPLSQETILTDSKAAFLLDHLPETPLEVTDPDNQGILGKTLCIIAIGGTDTTFYKDLSPAEVRQFAREIYGPDVFKSFEKYDAIHFIPRGLASKKSAQGTAVTNVESLILQAYHAGIKHVAVIGNSKSSEPIADYLHGRLGGIEDLHIVVTVQPLLPMIGVNKGADELSIRAGNGAYPGGHGHGFKYCLLHDTVQGWIREHGLEFFLFSNGDNAVFLNWGANHYAVVMRELRNLNNTGATKDILAAFFSVWEHLRKGGFTFILQDKDTGAQSSQVIEVELAEASGADVKRLESIRGGYNTNVVVGTIAATMRHIVNLPMALKQKAIGDNTYYLFEASLGTAMTTHQESHGVSVIDPNAGISVLGPKQAEYQHWNHIAIRKRDDFFAFLSSLFKVKEIETAFGSFNVLLTNRSATVRYPILNGNFVEPDVQSTKEFYYIFKDASILADRFTGTLNIDLQEDGTHSRGKIKFEGIVEFKGDATLSITVPPGQEWIIRDRTFDMQTDTTINRDDISLVEPAGT